MSWARKASRSAKGPSRGSIATTATTERLCEGYFEFRTLGPTAVKGLNAPVEVYEVTGLGPLRSHFQLAARRGLTKFVGREGELQQMKRALELARSGADIAGAVSVHGSLTTSRPAQARRTPPGVYG